MIHDSPARGGHDLSRISRIQDPPSAPDAGGTADIENTAAACLYFNFYDYDGSQSPRHGAA